MWLALTFRTLMVVTSYTVLILAALQIHAKECGYVASCWMYICIYIYIYRLLNEVEVGCDGHVHPMQDVKHWR